MSYFDDKEKMLIPLSIDRPESSKENYFTRDGKVLKMFLAILPLIVLLTIFMKQTPSILFIIGLILVYAVGYIIFLRIFIIEEYRFKKQLADMEGNKVSGLNYIYGISRIDESEKVAKILYRKQTGEKLRHGLVVTYDTGSLVNVPEGNNSKYLKTKEEFLNRLYRVGYDYRWYELKTDPKLPPSLIEYADILSKEDNEYAQMVLKMLLNINTACVMDSEQSYKDYIVVTNTTYANLRNFKKGLEDVIKNTLGANGYIIRPHIINKEELESFFNTYLMQNSLAFDNANQSNDFKPFKHYAKITRLLDEDGKVIPLSLVDKEISGMSMVDAEGVSLNDMVDDYKRKESYKEKDRLDKLNKNLDNLLKLRNSNKIDDITYKKRMAILKDRFSKENFPKLFDSSGRYRGETQEEIARKREKLEQENERRRNSRNRGSKKNVKDKRESVEKTTVDKRKKDNRENYDIIGIRDKGLSNNKKEKPKIKFGESTGREQVGKTNKGNKSRRPDINTERSSTGLKINKSKKRSTEVKKVNFGKKK